MLGERVLNRFILESRLGSGAYGTVYQAWDERLQRPVAVKVIENPARGERVMREAQAAARLAHPGIVTLYEMSRSYERAYLVTELVEGGTLRALARSGRLSDASIAEIGAECSDALAHAHEHGVIHRDIKPENILVAGKGGAKLVDFGIARIVDSDTLTAAGDVLGTLAYMAPEQAEGYRPGPHADVYSLALTLYEAWTGEHPLVRGSAAATARAIGGHIEPLGEVRPDLPEPLTRTIDAALDPDPGRRPDAADLAEICSACEGRLDTTSLAPADPEAPEAEHTTSAPFAIRPFVVPALLVALCAVVIAQTGIASDPMVLTVPLGGGILAFVRPRLAVGLAAAALAAWLAIEGSEIGFAAVLAAVSALAIARSGADLYTGREQPTPF